VYLVKKDRRKGKLSIVHKTAEGILGEGMRFTDDLHEPSLVLMMSKENVRDTARR